MFTRILNRDWIESGEAYKIYRACLVVIGDIIGEKMILGAKVYCEPSFFKRIQNFKQFLLECSNI